MTDGMPAEPIPFRVLLDEAMKLTRRFFGRMYLPVAIPLALLAGLVVLFQGRYMHRMAAGGAANPLAVDGCIGFVGVMLLWLAMSGLSSAVLTAAAMDGASGRPISMREKWGFILQPSVLGTLVLNILAIAVGLCLLIFPGILIALRTSFLVPIMSSEGLRGTTAMRRSWDLVKYNPHKRFLDNTATKIFLLYLVAGVIGWLAGFVVQLPFTAMQGVAAARDVASGAAGTAGMPWALVPAQMLGQLVSTAVGIYSSFGIVLLCLDVVRRKEGKDLASAIDARFGGATPPVLPPEPGLMPPLTHHAADLELVRGILAETGVSKTPERPPVTAYLGAWLEAVARWIAAFFEDRPGLAGGLLNAALVIAILTVVLALILLALSIVRSLRARGRPAHPAPRAAWTEVPEAGAPVHDPHAWKAQVEARLARGDVAGALEALWWWLASSLSPQGPIDASWTTRELLAMARRRELLGLGSELDVLMYGPAAPAPADVSACLARFEERLA